LRAARLEARDFRNLASLDLELPAEGAVFLGPNGQGKTNLLEAMYYPVLFRSLRGARDADLVRHDSPGFFVRLSRSGTGARPVVEAGFATAGGTSNQRRWGGIGSDERCARRLARGRLSQPT
jgi:recombinational DNA repair ATPase RecF